MPDIKKKDNLGNFSDIKDEIIIKENNTFQVFSHGNLSNLDMSKLEQKSEFSKSREVLDTGKEEINLAPPAPVVWDKKSSFYFDVQDEDDIAQEIKKIEKMNKESSTATKLEVKKYSLNKILKKIIENYDLHLLPELEKRLGNIVLSFLKHTRTKVDTLNLVKDSIDHSGLSLEVNTANKLIDLLDNIRNKVDQVGGVIVEDQVYKGESPFQNKKQQNVENLASFDPRQKIRSEVDSGGIPIIRRMPSINRQPNKTAIMGVKKKEKVIGPIDEFSEITLVAFRRLSSDPTEAAQKIMDKIRVLEKESYLKRATAIQNWRKSEIYKMYLDLGRESMEKNLSIDKIIEQKILAKEKVLTKKEFSAITDLNKKLRF